MDFTPCVLVLYCSNRVDYLWTLVLLPTLVSAPIVALGPCRPVPLEGDLLYWYYFWSSDLKIADCYCFPLIWYTRYLVEQMAFIFYLHWYTIPSLQNTWSFLTIHLTDLVNRQCICISNCFLLKQTSYSCAPVYHLPPRTTTQDTHLLLDPGTINPFYSLSPIHWDTFIYQNLLCF